MESQARILETATQQFMKLGVRNVTMDDLSSLLGISKKTIYQFYSNKEQLVMAAANDYFNREKSRSEQVIAESANAIDELVAIVRWSVASLRKMSPAIILEIRKFYPGAWSIFESFSHEYLLSKVTENLHRGIEEGLYRKDLDVEVISRLRIMQITGTLQQEFFPPALFDTTRVQLSVFEMYLRGIVSDQGRNVLDAYLSSAKNPVSEVEFKP